MPVNIQLVSHMIAISAFVSLANVVLMLALIVKPFSESWAWEIACRTAGSFWSYMQDHFERSLHGRQALVITGDEIPQHESALVISNHLGYTDTYLVQAIANRAGMLSRCRYFVKKEITRIPLFGWAFWAIGMILVSRNWTRDASSIENAFDRIKGNRHDCWIVLYPEGTRRTPEKVLKSQAFARRQGKVELDNLLLPRTKGFVSSVQALRTSHIKYLYDITLVYISAAPKHTRVPLAMDLLSCPNLFKAGYRFHIDVKRIAIADLPMEEVALAKWCEDRWTIKDSLIGKTISENTN